MSELAIDFSSLPPEYQDVLRLAQDTHNIGVTPLQELKGGRTGAHLYLVSVASADSDPVRHLVLKLDHKSKKTNLFLWMLGFPDRALERANDAVALANRLNHPFSMAYALFHTGLLHLWRREMELVQERAQAALDIAKKHEFHIWVAVATCLHGAGLAGMGRVEEGLAQINQGIGLYEALNTPPVFWPLLLLMRAGTCGQAGRPEEGLGLVDEAMEMLGEEGARVAMSSELCRLKGDLLLAQSPESGAEAEPWFQRALEIAREREAGIFELRAAVSLSRLWQGQGKAERGRRLLSDAYERMTEGFTTADLKEARALLGEFERT